MELPVGMLIYWAHRISDDEAFISGMWYHSEIYVPSTVDEKKQSTIDLKNKRCLLVSVRGSFSQICDLLAQTDKFLRGSDSDLKQFSTLTEQVYSSSKPILFDDVHDLKGTSLSLDTVFPVEEPLAEVQEQVKSGKQPFLTIAKDWSWAKDIMPSLGDP